MDLFNNLKIYTFLEKKHLGVKNDGGYVIGILDGNYDFYISAGVGNEESFTRDFINMYEMNKTNCAAFDGTIDDYPYEYTNNITFYRRNISPFKNDCNANLTYFTDNYSNIFLKMDIEAAEYPWLLSLSEKQIKAFKQIVIEFHGINDDSWDTKLSVKNECFKKLSNTHYAIHIHGNNYAGSTNNIPDVVEITYIRKNTIDYEPNLNNTTLPIPELDFPNNPNNQDFSLKYTAVPRI